jgi:hypothetical protein
VKTFSQRLIFRSSPLNGSANLMLVLLMGIFVRMVVALSRTDEVWPDAHFMSLEPASQIVFGRAYLAWEWQQGYRSWTLPLLYVPVLWLCKVFGFQGGLVLIYAGRCFTALISGLALKKFYEILCVLRLRPWVRWSMFAGFSLMPPMILWGVSALADLWVMIVWMTVLPSIYRLSQDQSNRSWLKLGLLVGLPILIKIQTGLFALALGLGFLFQRKKFSQLVFYSAGVLTQILILGGLDWLTYGVPFSALTQQIQRGEVTSRFYGVAPWFDYFPRLLGDQGAWLPLLLGVGFLVALTRWRSSYEVIRTRGEFLWMILGPALLYFGFHLCIPHKETRFLLPTLPALYILVGLGLHLTPGWVVLRRFFSRWSISPRIFRMGVLIAGLVSLFWVSRVPVYLTSVNIAPLEAQVYHLQTASGQGSGCLLLFDHHWSWTRGQLILGDGMKVIEKHVSDFSEDQDANCAYAILPESKLPLFYSKASPSAWRFVDQSIGHYVLIQKFQVR